MLIIRDIFVAKPGQASKLAKLFKKGFGKESNVRIMTDMVANYNTVVMEMQVDNLAEFEKMMEEYHSGKMKKEMDKDVEKEMANYTEMFMSGKREIFKVVD